MLEGLHQACSMASLMAVQTESLLLGFPSQYTLGFPRDMRPSVVRAGLCTCVWGDLARNSKEGVLNILPTSSFSEGTTSHRPLASSRAGLKNKSAVSLGGPCCTTAMNPQRL